MQPPRHSHCSQKASFEHEISRERFPRGAANRERHRGIEAPRPITSTEQTQATAGQAKGGQPARCRERTGSVFAHAALQQRPRGELYSLAMVSLTSWNRAAHGVLARRGLHPILIAPIAIPEVPRKNQPLEGSILSLRISLGFR
jgi:hypothetical protein